MEKDVEIHNYKGASFALNPRVRNYFLETCNCNYNFYIIYDNMSALFLRNIPKR